MVKVVWAFWINVAEPHPTFFFFGSFFPFEKKFQVFFFASSKQTLGLSLAFCLSLR